MYIYIEYNTIFFIILRKQIIDECIEILLPTSPINDIVNIVNNEDDICIYIYNIIYVHGIFLIRFYNI